MAGSARISDLVEKTVLDPTDLVIIVDTPNSVNKKVTIGTLDNRYSNEVDFSARFTTELATKSTNDIAEGITNLYYTDTRWDARLVTKSTADLTEGSNLYYTEARVSANSDVAANTADRHVATTLDPTATTGGMSIVGQNISNTEVSSSTNGYLSSSNFNLFSNKVDKSAGDLPELSESILASIASPTALPTMKFNSANVKGFMAIVSVEILATANLYETMILMGNNAGGTWIVSPFGKVGDNTNVTFSMTISTVGADTFGVLSYISGPYAGFTSGRVKLRALTTTI